MSGGPLVISFVGASGSGKTTLIERLVPELRAAGQRVGTVKHAPHGHDVADRVGSDSSRHRNAGADAVLLAGAAGAILFLAPETDPVPPVDHHSDGRSGDLVRLGHLIEHHLSGFDVVLAEGFAPVNDALVVVRRAGVPPKANGAHPAPLFTVGDMPTECDYRFDQVDEIVQRLLAMLAAARRTSPER